MQTMTGQEAHYYGGDDTPSIEDMAQLLENDRPMTADTGGITGPVNEDISGEHGYKVSAVDVKADTFTVVNRWAATSR